LTTLENALAGSMAGIRAESPVGALFTVARASSLEVVARVYCHDMDRSEDSLWATWTERTDAAFHHSMDLMWMRHMWKTMDGIIVEAAAPGSRGVQNHLTSTYVFAICTLIRRETDLAPSTSSLARQLAILRDTGGLITRSRYSGAGFDRYAPGGAENIDPHIVDQHIQELRDSANPVKTYTDKIIAHRERFGPDAPPLILQFSEIDHALAIIGNILTKYWPLVHPDATLARSTPVDDRGWFQAFTVPWIKHGQTFDDVPPPK
jgi:hypothetical protein